MDKELLERMERLELRLMDLEATLETLSRTSLDLEQRSTRQTQVLHQLEDLLKQLTATLPARTEPDPPPPHY